MKHLIPLLVTSFLVNPLAAIAKTYEASCFHVGEQKFKSCDITINDQAVVTEFKSDKYQEEDGSVAITSIKTIASGNYARRILTDSGSIAASILLAPLALANTIFKSDAQEYVLHINSAEPAEQVKIYRVKPQDAPEFQQELSMLTKKWVVFEEPKDNTLIDVGPDIKPPDIDL